MSTSQPWLEFEGDIGYRKYTGTDELVKLSALLAVVLIALYVVNYITQICVKIPCYTLQEKAGVQKSEVAWAK
jgi:hypothetical protein